MYEMPCKGTHETASYCDLCSLRGSVSAERSQVQGEDLWEPGMPCRVWENLREKTMGHFWDEGEPDIERVIDICPNRADRVRALGNAVVPQQAYPFFAWIAEILTEEDDR